MRCDVWYGGVKKFGQLALVEPDGVFLHQQVYAGAAVFGLVNQDVGHGFSPFAGKGRLKNIAGLFLITFFVIFFVIRSVEPTVPAEQFEQRVKAVLVGSADEYAACVAVFGEAKQDDFVKAVGVEALVFLAEFYDFGAVLLDKLYGLDICRFIVHDVGAVVQTAHGGVGISQFQQ